MEALDTITQDGITYNVYAVSGRVCMAVKVGKRGRETKQHRPATRTASGWKLHRWA